jgi:hypothetical protein
MGNGEQERRARRPTWSAGLRRRQTKERQHELPSYRGSRLERARHMLPAASTIASRMRA